MTLLELFDNSHKNTLYGIILPSGKLIEYIDNNYYPFVHHDLIEKNGFERYPIFMSKGGVRFASLGDGIEYTLSQNKIPKENAIEHIKSHPIFNTYDIIFYGSCPTQHLGKTYQQALKILQPQKEIVEFIESEESWGDEIKGWMGPDGSLTLLDSNKEHSMNIPHGVQLKTQHTINELLERGYCRFGRYGDYYFFHFLKSAKGGKTATIKAIDYLDPPVGSEICITPGFWGRTKETVFKNPSAAKAYVIGKDNSV